MKRAFVTLVLLTCAESAMARDWEVGVKGGANWTNVSMTPRELETSPEGQLLGGGFLAFRFSERVALGAEVLVTELAVTAEEAGMDARIDARAVQVPVPVEIDLGPTDGPHLFVSGGIHWTFVGRTVETIDGVESIDEEGRDWDVGPLLGGGLRVPLRRGALSFEARYVWGLRDQDEDDDSVKLRTLLFLVGYRF